MIPPLTHISSLLPASKRDVNKTIIAIVQQMFNHTSSPILIAVGGPGGTGKSTFCTRLARLLPHADVLALDDYKTSRYERNRMNIYGPHPDANRLKLIREHLQLLRNGTTIHKPVYNKISGAADTSIPLTPRRFIIIDGEVATYHHFHDLIHFSLFIDADWKTQLATRITRDISVRGYTHEKAVATFLHSNLKEFGAYGAESKAWADIHVYCHDDYILEIEAVSEQVFTTCRSLLTKNNRVITLTGCICALPVPFTATNKIDEASLVRHLEFLAQHGIQRILVNGTTGEFFSLTRDERRQVLRIARYAFPGMIIFGAGCEGLKATMEQIAWAERYGADALALLPPYFFSTPTEQGIIDYFKHIAAQTNIPLMLYNFPAHVGYPLTAPIIKQIPHVALKDSAGDMSLIAATKKYFIGGDTHISAMFEQGGTGFVSGTVACLPEPYQAMEQAQQHNDTAAVSQHQQTISRGDTIFGGTHNIARIKYALSHLLPGYPATVRLPLVPLLKEQQNAITHFLTQSDTLN